LYYINPWVFYLLGVSNSVGIACVSFLAVFAIVFGSYALVWFIESPEDERLVTPIQILKKWRVPLILTIAFLVFMPSEDTIYKMMIASQVTTENIDTAKETIQDVADYIIDAVKEIEEGSNT